jgi:hypothetical protein
VFTDDKATAEQALASGYFELVSSDAETLVVDDTAGTPLPPIPAYGGKTLDEMNVAELETFATYKGVSLKGVRKRTEIIEKLRAELPAEELEGEIEYGSPTMVELEDN